MDRYFTCSIYVFNPETKKFLFVKHKKLGTWLQPGGRLETNEQADETAVRIALEETGLRIRLISDKTSRKGNKVRPFAVQRSLLLIDEHEHLSLVYLAIPQEGALIQSMRQSSKIGWFSVEEVCDDEFNTLQPQKKWVRFFADLLAEKR